jgi:ABC-type sugar transport system ATPase subunit
MHLSLKNISKSYGAVKALEGIDFELSEGEVHAVCGENGAGKSTLMNILSGNIQPDNGEIFLNNRSVRFKNQDDAGKSGIAIAYQHLSLFENLNVAENIFVNRFPEKKSGIIDYDRLYQLTGEILEQLKIEHLFHPRTLVSTLSAGQKQMIEIAKALSHNPGILILDEPTASLSDNNKETLFEIIRSLKSKGTSVIYISHRMEEIFKISDRATVLKDGRWIASAPVHTLTKERLIELMVGRAITVSRKASIERKSVALEVRNITNRHVKNISFNLHKGEIVALAGLVGAGRTEIAKTIFGEIKKDAGTIAVNGKKVTINNPGTAIANKIAYLPEERKELGLFPDMNITENINAVSYTVHRPAVIDYAVGKQKAVSFKDRLRIACTSIEQNIVELSGGNQQKVVLARWLSVNPDILIIDEPTHGIDIGAKFEIYDLLQELASNGKAILLISSELSEILAISDRILVIKNGTIVKELVTTNTTEEEILTWAM